MEKYSFDVVQDVQRGRVERATVAALATRLLAATGSAHSADILPRLYEPALGAPELVALIECEPSLVLRVLKVANSAFYGQTGQIGTLDRALQVLGLDAVRGIATAACLNRRLYQLPSNATISSEELYGHSLAAALAARDLARMVKPELASQAFLVGMVHDLGVASLARLAGADWIREIGSIAASRDKPPAMLIAQEAQQLGMDHATAGAVAFDTWKLPVWLSEAVAAHHVPDQAPERSRALACIAFLADRQTVRCGLGLQYGDLSPELDAPAVDFLGLRPGQLDELAATLREKYAGLANVLDS